MTAQAENSWRMGSSLLRAALAWRRVLRAALAPHELTPTEFLVLDAVERLAPHGPEGTTQQMVANDLDMDKMSVSKTMYALDRRYLIYRGEVLIVGAWGVDLSDEGRALLKQALASVRHASAAHFGRLTSDKKFVDALRRIGPSRKPALKREARLFGSR